MKTILCLLLGTLAAIGSSALAQTTIEILPARDATLYESADGDRANGRGNHLFAGGTQNGDLRRALLLFDVAARIPSDATILSAELTLQMNRSIAGSTPVTVHPVTAIWEEGPTAATGQEGGGAPSAAGDVTWIHRSFDARTWSQPGGDFEPTPVASRDVDGTGSYSWQGDALAALVTDWLRGARPNHGVLLRGLEDRSTSAKRFGSREGATPPVQTVTFIAAEAPGDPIQIAGLWIDPTFVGEGYNVIQSSAGLTVFFFGYDSAGERLWLVSETLDADVFVDRTVQLVLFRGAGGVFDDPGEAIEEWGLLELTVTSCTSAEFLLTGADGSKRSDAEKLAAISGNDCEAAF